MNYERDAEARTYVEDSNARFQVIPKHDKAFRKEEFE